MTTLIGNLVLIGPEVCLMIAGLGSLVLGAWPATRRWCAVIVMSGLLSAAVNLWGLGGIPFSMTVFGGLLRLDGLALFARWLALATTALTLLMSIGARELDDTEIGEYYGLLAIAGTGLMLLSAANHFLMAVLAIEMVSLSSYLLVAYQRRDPRSGEAALKYFLFGALASGCMLYGIAWLFGLSHTLRFDEMLVGLAAHNAPGAGLALLVAIVLLLVGLGFKISMVPFHLWTPDAYEGAPTPVAAFLSVGPKVAGLALLVRLFATGLADVLPLWTGLLTLLTIATMTFGNLVALAQTNIKRLLAYSTIAQVGYLLIGFSVTGAAGQQSLLVYLAAYLLMNLGAFACVVAVSNRTGSEAITGYRGLARHSPGLALLLTLFLLSLAGLPPLVGFIGKFMLFGSAILTRHWALAVAGIVNSAIALYYYVFIIRQMYLEAPAEGARPQEALGWPLRLTLASTGLGTLLVGLFPGALIAWAGWAVLR